MKKEYAKNLQKALFVAFLFQFVTYCVTSKEGYYSYGKTKRGEGPWVSVEFSDQYSQFDRLLDIVKQTQKVIKAKDAAARDLANKDLAELMAREIGGSGKYVDPLVKKVIHNDIKVIQESTNKAALNKAYEHLCDIVLAIDAQKDIAVQESRDMSRFREAKGAITGSIRSGISKVAGFFGMGSSAQKPEIAKKPEEAAPWTMQKRPTFDLSAIVQQVERVVKAENDDERKHARLALNTLMHNDRLHPAVKKVLAEDVAIILGSGDTQAQSKAYDRLRDIVDLINSLKFVAIDVKPELSEILEAKIKAIVPQKIQEVARKIAARMPAYPTVGVPYWSKLIYLNRIMIVVDRIVNAQQDDKARKAAQEELKALLNEYSELEKDLGEKYVAKEKKVEKVIYASLTTLMTAADKAILVKAREYLADIFAAINFQKDAFEKLEEKVFSLKQIVEKADAVVKAQDDNVRQVARKALAQIMADKNLDPNVKKIISVDILVIQKSADADALSKAYQHLSDVIDAVTMDKSDISFYEGIGYGELAYRKVKGLVKKVVPESVQNFVDKSVEFLVGKHPFAKSDFYQGLMLGAVASAAGSGIRAMLNKYKILTYMPELKKNAEKGLALREKRLQRAVQVYNEGRTPGQDETSKNLTAEIEKTNDEWDNLVDILWKAGIPSRVLNVAAQLFAKEDLMYEIPIKYEPATEASAVPSK